MRMVGAVGVAQLHIWDLESLAVSLPIASEEWVYVRDELAKRLVDRRAGEYYAEHERAIRP